MENSTGNTDGNLEVEFNDEEIQVQEKEFNTGESRNGITEYILKDFAGLTGTLKQRYSDFVVEEIDEDGQVVKYDPECLYQDQTLLPVKIENEESAKTPEKADEEIIQELSDLFLNDTNFAESILKLNKEGSFDGADQLIFPQIIESKEARTRIHQYFKSAVFGGRLVTDTFEGKLRISVKVKSSNNSNNEAGLGQKRRYDQRNDQNPANRPAPFIMFNLHKEGMDTIEVINMLARKMVIPPKTFSYAGTKDKRGITVQRIVARNLAAGKIAGIGKIAGGRVKVSNLRRASGPLGLGDLKGNRFTIVLRDLKWDIKGDDLTDIVREACESLDKNGFINYYGLQRFGTGSVSTNQVGEALLNNNFEAAVNLILNPREDETNDAIVHARRIWHETKDPKAAFEAFPYRCTAERQILQHFLKQGNNFDFQGAIGSINRELRLMYVHSVQSWWWNRAASERVRLFGAQEVVLGDLVQSKDDDRIIEVTEENKDQFSVFDVVLPLIGYNTIYPVNAIGDFLKEQVKNDFMFQAKNKSLWDLPGSYRHLLQKPGNITFKVFHYDNANADNLDSSSITGEYTGLQLSFGLPTSAYATMVLREFFPRNANFSTDAAFQKRRNLS